MASTVISYPVPLYQNVPITPQFYEPSRFEISDITLGNTTIITTAEDHNYVIGQLVRTLVPLLFGTYQLNERTAYVISVPNSSQVEIDIDSSQMNAFKTSTVFTKPQIVAVGDINSGVLNNLGNMMTGTAIAGSFQNISPL